jgi:hypothetical protein
MAEVRIEALEAELDIRGLHDPGSMASAVYDELGGDEDAGVLPWPHDSWVELNRQPPRFVTLVAAEEADMDGLLERVEATLRRDRRWEVLAIRRRPVSSFESEAAMYLTKVYRAQTGPPPSGPRYTF